MLTLKKLKNKSHNLIIALLDIYGIDENLITEIYNRCIDEKIENPILYYSDVEKQYNTTVADRYMECVTIFLNICKKSKHAKRMDEKQL